MEAIDLLTDFVGRPKIDAEELDRERGVVIQEIQRYKDQPAAVAEELIDRAHVRRPPARAAPCWAPRTTCGPSRARRSSPSASAAGPARAAAPSSSATSTTCPRTASVDELFARFPDLPEPEAYVPAPPFEPRTLVEQRDSNQSHLRMSYRPQVDPSTTREARAAFTIYSTLLGGSMGSRLFDEIREQRGLCYSVYAHRSRLRRRARAAARRGPRLEQVRRGLHAHARDRRRAAADGPDRGGGRAGPRLRRRPARAGLREHERGRALRGQPARSSTTRTSTPTPPSPRSTRSPSTRSSRSPARSTRTKLAVACVGPHESDEF